MGAYKLNIGDATHYLKWDGAVLTIKGLVGDITLENTGFIRTSGKDSYADPDSGFWLGYDVDTYKLNIGDTNHYLKWDGTDLTIKGDVTITGGSGIANLTDAGDLAILNVVEASKLGTTVISGGYLRTDLIKVRKIYVGGGTDEDIEFEDSGVRMYDAGNRVINIYKSGYKYLQLALGSTAGVLSTDGKLQLSGAGSIELWAGSKIFHHYSTGTLQLPRLVNAPTAHDGDCALKTTTPVSSLHIYTTLLSNWYHSTNTTAGW